MLDSLFKEQENSIFLSSPIFWLTMIFFICHLTLCCFHTGIPTEWNRPSKVPKASLMIEHTGHSYLTLTSPYQCSRSLPRAQGSNGRWVGQGSQWPSWQAVELHTFELRLQARFPHKFQCPTRLHSQNIISKIKLARMSSQSPQRIIPQAQGTCFETGLCAVTF